MTFVKRWSGASLHTAALAGYAASLVVYGKTHRAAFRCVAHSRKTKWAAMTFAQSSRRAFFSRLRGDHAQLRPPWSRADDIFTDSCSLCGDCFKACPTNIIVPGRAGYPILDFTRGACTFCAGCRDICPNDCFFVRSEHQEPWALEARIGKSCVELSGVACRVCQDACEQDAIRFRPVAGGRSQPAVVSERCTGCGACVRGCPVRAISVGVWQSEAEDISA